MKRFLPLPFVVVLMACPGDKKPQSAAAATPIPVDTTQRTDLSTVKTNTPPPAPDTFRTRKLAAPAASERAAPELPDAPPPLVEAVQREQSVSQFCFTEFGKKADPALRGNVAMAVSVSASGVSDVRVASSAWSSSAGQAVDHCLTERARRAWKLAPGSVKPGKYAVRLSFSGS